MDKEIQCCDNANLPKLIILLNIIKKNSKTFSMELNTQILKLKWTIKSPKRAKTLQIKKKQVIKVALPCITTHLCY